MKPGTGVPEDYLNLVKKWKADFDKKVEKARFNEIPESYLRELIEENLSSVKRYSTEKLAGIFSGCIEWRGQYPRQETDWLFAENTIDTYVAEDGLRGFAEKGIVLGAYETLPRETLVKLSSGNVVLPRDKGLS